MILTVKQHGFRKKKSTLSAIVEFLHDVPNNLSRHLDSYIIFLDLKKAFDTVSHEILLNKLNRIGLDENSILWFDSYLKNRKQSTVSNNGYSTELPVIYGVPQGSVLGPTLFTIYINDLIDHVQSRINFYADDTIIYDVDPDVVQRDLTSIYNWCNINLLTINCKKSQWMKTDIISKRNDDDITFTLGDTPLEKVSEYKYLGMTVDSLLTFQSYRETLINRVNLKVSYFRKIRKYLTLDSALIIYKCTILSYWNMLILYMISISNI